MAAHLLVRRLGRMGFLFRLAIGILTIFACGAALGWMGSAMQLRSRRGILRPETCLTSWWRLAREPDLAICIVIAEPFSDPSSVEGSGKKGWEGATARWPGMLRCLLTPVES